jgi:hypothetical protein
MARLDLAGVRIVHPSEQPEQGRLACTVQPEDNHPASREEVLGALRGYEGAVVLVTHDEGAVDALEPERVVLLPDGVEDLWGEEYRDLVSLA